MIFFEKTRIYVMLGFPARKGTVVFSRYFSTPCLSQAHFEMPTTRHFVSNGMLHLIYAFIMNIERKQN